MELAGRKKTKVVGVAVVDHSLVVLERQDGEATLAILKTYWCSGYYFCIDCSNYFVRMIVEGYWNYSFVGFDGAVGTSGDFG